MFSKDPRSNKRYILVAAPPELTSDPTQSTKSRKVGTGSNTEIIYTACCSVWHPLVDHQPLRIYLGGDIECVARRARSSPSDTPAQRSPLVPRSQVFSAHACGRVLQVPRVRILQSVVHRYGTQHRQMDEGGGGRARIYVLVKRVVS